MTSTPTAAIAVRDRHRCAWWPGCANPDRTDRNNPRPAMIIDGVICEGCTWRLTKVVRWLATDFLRLHLHIGERGAATGQRVHSTRDPGIPINVATEALMNRLVEVLDRAASMVESELGMTGVARARSDSSPATTARGYLAANGYRHTTPSDGRMVSLAARTLHSTVDVLIDVEPQWHLVWLPLPDNDEEADRYKHGQPRELVELSGLDVARELVNVHHLIRMQLGLTRLRAHSDAPCHRCGSETLGRDNGCWDIDCTTCGARYTEDEHGFLIRCTVDESQSRDEDQMLKYLLAEAYYRLDLLRKRTSILGDLDESTVNALIADGRTAELAAILRGVVDQCADVLTAGDPEWPHPKPEDRQIGVREHEKKLTRHKELDAAVTADADEVRANDTKPLPAGVTYSTTTPTDDTKAPTARRRERSKR